MRLWTCVVTCGLIAVVGGAPRAQHEASTTSNHPLSPGEKGGMDETGPYEVVPDHFKPPFPAGWTWGPIAGVHVESPDRVYVYSRGMLPELKRYMNADGLPVRSAADASNPNSEEGKHFRREHILTVYDKNGNLIADWKQLDAMHAAPSWAHAIRVNPWDPEKHLWLLDMGLNQILKVTREGTVVMRIGIDKATGGYEASSGAEAVQKALAWPAEMAAAAAAGKPIRRQGGGSFQNMVFLPNGDFLALLEGGIIKFSKDGRQLSEFGKRGTAPGEIVDNAHSFAVDGRGRIYVGEHGGSRIQVFDQDGKQLDLWPNVRFGSGYMVVDKKDRVWIASGETHRFVAYDFNGKFVSSWGVLGMNPGQLYGTSGFDVDSQGNLYQVEHFGGRIQLFRPKQGVDSKQLMGQLLQ